ncbi:MAG: PAS domain S-box protein [Actinomycetota bacterium]|nr:PAS domain S-box protein [Actinomycetota bacterium]
MTLGPPSLTDLVPPSRVGEPDDVAPERPTAAVLLSGDCAIALREPKRLRALRRAGLMDVVDPGLDRLCRAAARALGVPMVLVSLAEVDRQHFPGKYYPPDPDGRGSPINQSLCQFVATAGRPLVISDTTTDQRVLAGNVVLAPNIVAYAGMPVRSPDGEVLGSMCAVDERPRQWTAQELEVLSDLAISAEAQIATRIGSAALRQAAAETQAILDGTNDAFVRIDAEGVITDWNPAAERIFGWAAADVIGRALDETIVPPAMRKAHRRGLQHDRPTGESRVLGKRLEMPAVRADGSELMVEMIISALDDPAGGYFAFLHDVTDRHRAQRELSDSKALFDAMFDNTAAVISIKDLEGRYVYVNRQAEVLFALPKDQVHGKRDAELLPHDVAEAIRANDLAVLDLGEAETILEQVPTSEGLRQYVSTKFPLRDTDGSAWGLCGIAIDDTARQRAERELARARRQLDEVVSRLDDYVFTVEIKPDGTVHHVYSSPNSMRVFGVGLDPADELTRTFDELVHPEDAAAFRDWHDRGAAGLPAEIEYRVVGTDGQLRWVWTRSHPRREDGLLLLDGISSDVTQRRELTENLSRSLAALRESEARRDAAASELASRNAQLELSNSELDAANQLKLDLIGMLSHEIGTPMTVIKGYAETILGRTSELPPLARSGLEAIARSADQLEVIRREVLTMCALDAGSLHAERERVPLAPALLAAVEVACEQAPVICDAALEVLVHPVHLQQIVVNFLTNARKYGGGVTAVDVTDCGGTVQIRVRDAGTGVPADFRDSLFERFTRDSANGRSIGGSGLGLYIVRGLAEANEGSVWYEEAEPRGSVFVLELHAAR